MIVNARHIGIIVKDLVVSARFFENILGLERHGHGIEIGLHIDNVVGLNNVNIEWVKFKTGNCLIELLQYKSHQLEQIKLPQIGSAHIALTVKNIYDVYEKLNKNGYICNCCPQQSVDGKAKFMYCNGPDGIVLELVEEFYE